MTISTYIELRRCMPNDCQILQALGRKTFSDAFAAQNTPENLRVYMDKAFNDERMQSELANPNSQFWLGEKEGQPVGYLKLNFAAAQTEPQEEPSLEIERIYVVQELQRAGLGQLFFEKALNIARASNVRYLWLGVWEHNDKAMRFYEKQGLRTFGQHTFYLGDEVQTDIMMRLEV